MITLLPTQCFFSRSVCKSSFAKLPRRGHFIASKIPYLIDKKVVAEGEGFEPP